ncbi:MAG: hypothetical protein GXO02_04475 [Epsilonproteobacteria bacterium]|nr:hypothetical protein [Campylobacterota bacterium]
MAKDITMIDEFKLSGTENGKVEVAIIKEPYGEGSESVASIGIFLDGSNSEPDWKVHIPKENIDRVIEALKVAKEKL